MKKLIRTNLSCCCIALFSFLLAEAAESQLLDFDKDGRGDLAVYDPSLGRYFVRFSSRLAEPGGNAIGGIGDVPAPGDYDNDGVTDQGTFNRSRAEWNFILSTRGALNNVKFGYPGDLPVPAQYSGYPCTDLATFNQQSGIWTIGNCAVAGDPSFVHYGLPGDIPVPADYDGDGLDDIAVVSPGTMFWRIRQTSRRGATKFLAFGLPGDIPVPADFSGNGKVELAVFRPSENVIIVRSPDGKLFYFPTPSGELGDRPSIVDVEGDSKVDLVVFHPKKGSFDINTSQFHTFRNISLAGISTLSLNPASVPLPPRAKQFQKNAVPGDWDRDLRSDLSFLRPLGGLNRWMIQNFNGGFYTFDFGFLNDIVLSGDTDGDLRDEAVLVRKAADGMLEWYIRTPFGDAWLRRFGLHNDRPVLGDFDCDGKDDVAVARNTEGELNWFFWLSSPRLAEIGSFPSLRFGLEGDTIGAADMDGDGCDEAFVSRPFLGGHYWFTKSLVSGDEGIFPWGLAGVDTPLAPMDFDGDGSDDPIVVRKENDFQTAYIRTGTGLAKEIPLGVGGTPFSGFFSGITKAELAVYHPASASQAAKVRLHRFDGFEGDFFIPALIPQDTLFIPGGMQRNTDIIPSTTQSALPCDLVTNFVDGGGGRLWKQASEYTHKPVFLLPKSYWSRVSSIDILAADGTKLLEGTRRTCCPNGGRAHYDVPEYASALDDYAPITVRLNFGEGGNECLSVPVPSQRWD